MDSDLVRKALLVSHLLSLGSYAEDEQEIGEYVWRIHLQSSKIYSAVKAAGSESTIIFTLEPDNLLSKKYALKCDFVSTFIEIMAGLKEHEHAG